MKNFMYSIGKKAIIASKNKINSKLKNKVLDHYINLIKKNKRLIIKQNSKDIKLAIRKNLRNNRDTNGWLLRWRWYYSTWRWLPT